MQRIVNFEWRFIVFRFSSILLSFYSVNLSVKFTFITPQRESHNSALSSSPVKHWIRKSIEMFLSTYLVDNVASSSQIIPYILSITKTDFSNIIPKQPTVTHSTHWESFDKEAVTQICYMSESKLHVDGILSKLPDTDINNVSRFSTQPLKFILSPNHLLKFSSVVMRTTGLTVTFAR